jgi:hypothetical protein
VKVERGIMIARAQKRADYAFFLAPNFRDVRFFVEAKKPSVELANADAYFQTIRYGWNAGTPLAVLTDFEQFHILDCRARPDINTALRHAYRTYRYADFRHLDTFAEVYWLFSREAHASGAFERFLADLPTPKGGPDSVACFPVAFAPLTRPSWPNWRSIAPRWRAPSNAPTRRWTAMRSPRSRSARSTGWYSCASLRIS